MLQKEFKLARKLGALALVLCAAVALCSLPARRALARSRSAAARPSVDPAETTGPEGARRETEAGVKLYRQGRLADALKSLDAAVENDDSFLPAHAARAMVRRALDDLKGSREDVEKCASMKAESVLDLALRGNTRLLAGNIPGAVNDFNQAILNNAYYADAYLGRGLAYEAAGNSKDAMDDWKHALSLDPKSSVARLNLARALKSRGNIPQAEEELSKILTENPQFPPAYALRAAIHADRREQREAVSDYSKAIQLNPRFVGALLGRARAYLQLNDKESALKDYAEAVRIAPEEYAPYFERGEARWKMRDYDAALDDFKKALDTRLDDPAAALSMGEHLLASKLKDEALRMYSKALDAARTASADRRMQWTETALLQRADLHLILHENKEALQDIDTAVEVSSNSPSSLIARADFYFQISQDAKAQEELTAILDEYPEYPRALLLKGKLEARHGRWKEALRAFDAVITATPEAAEAYDARGMVYAFADDQEKAAADLSKAVALSPSRPQFLLHYAEIEINRGHYLKALDLLEKASDIRAAGAPTLNILQAEARLHALLGNVPAAEDDLRLALQLEPQSEALYESLADAELQALNIAQAQKYLDRAAALGSSPRIHFKQGLIRAMRGEYEDAVRELRLAEAAQPQSAEIQDSLCRALRLDRKFRKAIRACDRAIDADPGLALAWIDRGLTRLRMKDYAAAVADLRAGRSKGARLASAELARSAAHAALGQFRDSDDAYRSAMDVDPTAHSMEIGFIGGKPDQNPDYFAFMSQLGDSLSNRDDPFAFLARGNAFHNAGQFDAAIAEYGKALATDASLAPAYLDRCDALSAKDSMEAAQEDCRHAAELNGKDARFQIRLIGLLVLQHRLEPALEAAAAAIRGFGTGPYAAELYLQGGNIRYFLKDYPRARDNYQLALAADLREPDAYSGLGLCHYIQKEFMEAIENFSRAIALNPRKESYYRNRAAAYVGLGNFQSAASDYRNALAVNTDAAMAAEYQRLLEQALSRAPEKTPLP